MENPKNRKWRVVRSEYLARKPWFTVRHETISLPDGRTIPDYYVFEYPDWVNVTAIDREGRFVMIDQYRHGLGETSYEIPAGVAEPSDETMLAAAQRELLEETGHGRRTARRAAARPDGGYPRASPLPRRSAGAAPHRPHPAGVDGRTALALVRRRGHRRITAP